jgi:hypothetical protein
VVSSFSWLDLIKTAPASRASVLAFRRVFPCFPDIRSHAHGVRE